MMRLVSYPFIPMPDDFDIENFTKEVFFMFSGEKVFVDLRCDNSLMKTMVERFGEDVTTLAYDMTSFRVQTEVSASRVEVDNYASQALHRKLGAVPNGMSEFLLHGEEIIKYQNENQHLIDDNIRKLAADFGVEPIEILGHVLEYKIEWK